MAVSLMAHQKEGVDFLIREKSGLLAFEQGLGKTRVVIEAYRRLAAAVDADRLLVMCPNSLKRNWQVEIARCAPELGTDVAEGLPRERRRVFAASTADVLIVSYETARAELTALLAFAERHRTVLVLDESHAAKNWDSQTSTAARQLAPACAYRWLLSGTPVTNSPADLYAQAEIIAPGQHVLGSMESFLASAAQDPSGSFAADVLERIVLRRTKEQCLDLPTKTFVDVRIDLPPWQRKLYDDMRTRLVCDIRAMSGAEYRASAPTVLAQMAKLLQLASNPLLLFPEIDQQPGKFQAAAGLLADILALPDRKAIIWTNYVRSVEMLTAQFSEYGAVALYGGTPAARRQDIAERFQHDPATRILIGNPAAAGTGFTLTSAAYALYETLSWRYDHYAQSQDRNHRIGQQLPVTYLRLIAADTIDEAVAGALAKKGKLARSLLGDAADSTAFSSLSQDEVCELITNNRLPQAA